MDKLMKRAIFFIVLALVVAAVANLGFAAYNAVATPAVNEIALNQLGDNAADDTAARIVVENKPMYFVQYTLYGLATVLALVGIAFLIKSIWNFASKEM